ncbi:MAG: type II secretion system protein M, partial [Clostridiales Family XIII bacterium]|nr:type II secretion system protein M [Clostridiales Family XIII bacterium]
MIGQPPKTGVKQSAVKAFLASRTKRERMMLLLLAVVAAAAFLMYALVIPALTKINDLADEVALLEEKKAQYHNAITQSDAQQKRYLDAVAAYDRAQGTYARPMTPESLDETITRLLLEADFEMETLSITPLSSEATPPFSPEPLEDNPLAAA